MLNLSQTDHRWLASHDDYQGYYGYGPTADKALTQLQNSILEAEFEKWALDTLGHMPLDDDYPDLQDDFLVEKGLVED